MKLSVFNLHRKPLNDDGQGWRNNVVRHTLKPSSFFICSYLEDMKESW